ncbi:DoxX family protein [Nocardia spumae]|uniref:DoxX family protein n=1 Tax=Nocardia spumae TaxID=2887190 RepID=UPI001D156AB5|nr:DoxX family protein [Nocardia spumae]
MDIAYLTVMALAVVANTFSGLAAVTRFGPVMATLGPAMETAGIPRSWLIFPIGTLKLAGAAGLVLGMAGVPYVGTAAAIGLVLYFVCAAYTHVRVADYGQTFSLAVGVFLPLAVACTVLQSADHRI